jgi:diacylglycerol kinase
MDPVSSSPERPPKPSRYTDSINYALEGILYAARNQKHMRNHFLAALGILAAVLFLRVSSLEFILLAISVSFVLFAELMNTAVELCVDIVSPGYHPLAKRAKDVAAGAVLIAAIGAAVMGCLILSHYIFPPFKEALTMVGTPTEMGTLVAILSVVILVERNSPGGWKCQRAFCRGLCHCDGRLADHQGSRQFSPDPGVGDHGEQLSDCTALSYVSRSPSGGAGGYIPHAGGAPCLCQSELVTG